MSQWGLLGELKYRLVAVLGKALYTALSLTTDGELENRDATAPARAAGHPIIYAFWHGRLFVPLWTHRNRGIGILISQSKDGEYVARVANAFGFHTIRGSSTRGAEEGFRLLMDELEKGRDVAITPDGPVGPKYEVKKGLIFLARATNAAIVPVGMAIDRYKQLHSWDEFRIVLPFAYVLARYGDPIYVGEHSNKAEMEALRKQVEDELKRLTDDCEARVADARRTKRERKRHQCEP
jgi:lysophospholipid acyltransferase (LPLAT)-like uncharacterized protein